MGERISVQLFDRVFKIHHVVILVILVIVGAIIRLYKLTYVGLWLDELFSMNGADPAKTLMEVYEYSKGDQPPLFFFLLHGWLKLFGYTDFVGRLLAVLFGLTGIVAIYFLGKEFKNSNVGLIAAFITAINWFHADMSREIRFYPLVFLLSTLSYLFFLRSIKNGKTRDFILYALSTSLLLNTHYYALVVFLSQIIIFSIIVVFYQPRTRLILGGLLSGLLAGLSIMHWMFIILKDLHTDHFHVLPVPFYFPLTFGWVYFKDPIAGMIYAVCAFLALRYVVEKLRKRRLPQEDLIVLCWIFFGFFVPLLYSWIRIPLLTPKYSTITLPGLYLLIASGFGLIEKARLRMYLVMALLAGAFIALYVTKPLSRPRVAEDWRDVARYFVSHSDKPQTIFAQLAYFHIFYFKHFGYRGELPVDQRWADFRLMVNNSDRIWLLKNPRYPDDGFNPYQQQLIDSLFRLKKEVQFNETKAFLYERRE